MHYTYYTPGTGIFNNLKKGSVVVLLCGAGMPPVKDTSTSEVILDVDGFSALTNTGRLLACTDAALMNVTGQHLAEGEYEVAPEALEKLRQAKVRLLFLSACLAVSAGIAYIIVTQKPKTAPRSEAKIPRTPAGQPTASPSATPTPKPLTFAEMNALYGPCASLPVLMYHHVQEDETAKQNDNGYLTVSPANFEKHLAYLNDRGYTSVGPADLIAFFNQGQSLPKKGVLLTFDDAYADFASFAVPLLSRYGIKSTLFVPTGLVENPGYLSWSTISSINNGTIYFGNHTWSHKNMGASLETIKKEIATAQTQLTEHGLDPLKVFAYPYGTINQRAVGFLRNSGFQLAFTTTPGRTLCAKQRLSLPRIRVGNVPSLASYGL